ncbi:MAG: hypothetical protein K9H64_23780 [Bacteroidales bacterium]|nr:hypothetical protein [Bacteroidales bacterium]MCF8457781.1 hypothetical protein [Bacteroidales bacterium]
MKKTILLSIFLLASVITYSQRVLLEENLANDTSEVKWGQNLRHYGHFYFGLSIPSNPAEKGSEIMHGNSLSFDVGYRYKLKLCNWYALGADLNFSTNAYRLKQDAKTKILPDSIEHDKESILAPGMKFEIYQRFNFGKRGNHVGDYLDIGAYGTYFFATRHYTMDKNPTEDLKKLEITETGLDYMENTEYGISVRAGHGQWVIFGKYRLSDLFKTTANYPVKLPELPALRIGVEISIF